MTEKRRLQMSPSAKYIAKASALSPGETELLGQRMRERFARRREDAKRSVTEILALQLEFEDKQLDEWRSCLTKIRQNTLLAQVSAGISLQQNA